MPQRGRLSHMLSVEIFSDVVCPWCAVGIRRFQRAVARSSTEVDVRYRSFELDPRAPAVREGDYAGLLARKYGMPSEQAQQWIDRMTADGAAEGIAFRFDLVRPGNTFDAHRVLHLAADRGLQQAVKERLLLGYHCEGATISDRATLTRLAAEAGMDDGEVARVLEGDDYGEAVRADESEAVALGISGVPFTVLGGVLGLPGAQPVETILAAMARAEERLRRAAADRPPQRLG